jgi:hypothetical protein
LNNKELFALEKLLCSSEELGDFHSSSQSFEMHEAAESMGTSSAVPCYPTVPDLDDFVTRFYIDYPNCKQFVTDFYASTSSRYMAGETQDLHNNGLNENISRIDLCDSISDTVRTENEANVGNTEVVPSWESTEESEDESEYIGETSECETVVTVTYNEAEEVVSHVERDSRTSVSVPDLPVACSYPGLRESLVFEEHLDIKSQSVPVPSSCSCTSHLDIQMQAAEAVRHTSSTGESQYSESCGHVPYSDTIKIPKSVVTGFLLANQVGHESMLASRERIASPGMPNMSPGAGGSLPDGDSLEALSVATATLSTLLLSSPNVSPVRDLSNYVEEDSSILSPLDSGVGTVVSCSDTGSLSDRSPDAASGPVLVQGGTKVTENLSSSHISTQTCEQRWQVQTIPCNCTVSDMPTVSSNLDSDLHGCSSVNVKTPCGLCQKTDVDGCLAVVTTCNNDVCDNTTGGTGKDILTCQNCLLLSGAEDVGKQDLLSDGVESLEVLNDGHNEFTHQLCDEDQSGRAFYDKTMTGSCSCSQNSFWNSRQKRNVILSDNVGDHVYDDINVNCGALCNTDASQDLEENCDDSNGGGCCKQTNRWCNSVPVSTLHLNGAHEGMVVSNGGCEQNESLPSVVIKMEECQEKGSVEKWFGVASGDRECSLCSGSDAFGAQSEIRDCLQNSAHSWDGLVLKQHDKLLHSRSEYLAELPGLLEQKTAENERVDGNRKASFHANSSENVASSVSTTGDTKFHPGGSTRAVVPSQSGR